MPQFKDLTPEQQEEYRERARARTRQMHAEGRFPQTGKGKGTRARANSIPSSSPSSRSRKGDVTALGSMAWGMLSLPVGIASPSGGWIMRLQMPQAGRDIDTLLKGTAIYDALTSGARAEKAVAAYHLGAPVALAVVGDAMDRMSKRNPGDQRIAAMMGWVEMMLRQVLADQGLRLPDRPQPVLEPEYVEVREAPVEPHGAAEPEPPAYDSSGNGEAPQEVAAAAASASRFDHVE